MESELIEKFNAIKTQLDDETNNIYKVILNSMKKLNFKGNWIN